MKNKLIIIGIATLFLLSSCQKELSQNELAREFCSNLDLEDYQYDCSKWRNLSKEYDLDYGRYQVECSFDSIKNVEFTESGILREYGCGVDFYLIKRGMINATIKINHARCENWTLKNAFNECKSKLPRQLENITIILPK